MVQGMRRVSVPAQDKPLQGAVVGPRAPVAERTEGRPLPHRVSSVTAPVSGGRSADKMGNGTTSRG